MGGGIAAGKPAASRLLRESVGHLTGHRPAVAFLQTRRSSRCRKIMQMTPEATVC
jgi:hypothetical protein